MNRVLITGASGALGSVVASRFAADPHTTVVLLLRADSADHLENRRQQLVRFLREIGLDESAEGRIEVQRGDISQPSLGLDPSEWERLGDEVTHVVHSAGNVKLNRSLEDARETAVDSAREVVRFVRRCQESGRFEKLEFVSTVGVAGRTDGRVPEARVSGAREPIAFHNTYEAAKWEAERYLGGEIDAGLPATIHRPSMIVGDSGHGRIIHFQVFYHLTEFLLGRRTWGFVPRVGEAVLDIIPVDYVAEAIYLAATKRLGQGEVWHLCSGPEHAWTLRRLITELTRLIDQRGESPRRTRELSLGAFRRLLRGASVVAPARPRRFLQGLPFLLDYLDERQLFENARTDRLLREHGLAVPAVESYLETIMVPYWDRPRTPKTRR